MIFVLVAGILILSSLLTILIVDRERRLKNLQVINHNLYQTLDRVEKVIVENAAIYPEAMSLVETALSDRRKIQ